MAITTNQSHGVIEENETSPAIVEIPVNKTLYTAQFTADAPVKPEIVQKTPDADGIQNIEQLFGKYQPKKDIEFENEEGGPVKETIRFDAIKDFSVKNMTEQSPFLQEVQERKLQSEKFAMQIQKNKQLMKVLNDPQLKKLYFDALNAILQELEDAK